MSESYEDWQAKFYFVVVLRKKTDRNRYAVTVSENRPTEYHPEHRFQLAPQHRSSFTDSFTAGSKTEAMEIAERYLQQRKRWAKRPNAKVVRLYYEGTNKSTWSP